MVCTSELTASLEGAALPLHDIFGVPDLRLIVVNPCTQNDDGSADASTHLGQVRDPRGVKLVVAGLCRGSGRNITSIDMTLFFKNREGSYSQELKILEDDLTLKCQGVQPGALIVCQLADWDPRVSKLGSSTYYMWAADEKVVPESIRLQLEGPPVRLKQDAPVAVKDTRIVKKIMKFSWIDESRHRVKLYIDVKDEPDAVIAAGGDDEGVLETEFGEDSVQLRVNSTGSSHVFAINALEHQIVPADCKATVKFGKRITVTLVKKKKDALWNTLYRRG